MANDCTKIMRLVEDFKNQSKSDRNNAILTKISQILGKQGVKLATKVATKSVAAATGVGVVFDLLMPTSMSTGRDQYYENLKNILEELEHPTPNANVIKRNYDLLKDAYRQILIEKDFGINSNCYSSLDTLTKEIGTLVEGNSSGSRLM